MNGMNFFGWIRDGVRQSVLLGVSDAVGQLGTPTTQSEELHPVVAGLLKTNGQDAGLPKLTSGVATPTAAGAGGARSRKRLGKSLKEMGAGGESAS